MVGGDKEIFEKIKPVLNVLGTNINYVGNAGSEMCIRDRSLLLH